MLDTAQLAKAEFQRLTLETRERARRRGEIVSFGERLELDASALRVRIRELGDLLAQARVAGV